MHLGSKIGKKSGGIPPRLGGGSIVGIDISDHTVKMVQISGRSQERIKIENCVAVQLPSGAMSDGKVANSADLVATLQQAAGFMGGLPKNVVVGVPNSIVTLQNFSYDPSSGMDMEDAATFETTQIAMVDDVNFDFFPTKEPGADGAQNVLLALTKKEDLEPILGALEEAGIQPVVVDTEDTARVNAFSYWINVHSPDLENSVVAVFDIGDEHTQVQVLQAGNILFNQDFQVGGKHLVREIQRTFQISLEEAEQMKISPNKPENYRDVLESFNAQVAQETRRALQFFYTVSTTGTAQKVERIFLTGGGSVYGGLAEAVTATNSIPTQVVHPLEYATVSGKVNQEQIRQSAARYTVALGLALRGLV